MVLQSVVATFEREQDGSIVIHPGICGFDQPSSIIDRFFRAVIFVIRVGVSECVWRTFVSLLWVVLVLFMIFVRLCALSLQLVILPAAGEWCR